MRDIWNRIESWLAINAPKLLNNLRPGAIDAQIQEIEELLGVQFPEDFKASYRIHDGQVFDAPNFFDNWEFLSLKRIIDEYNFWKELWNEGKLGDGREECRGNADGAIKINYHWNPKWIPITNNSTGDNECLDLDPDENGTFGQVIIMWHNDPDMSVIANSFRAWLEQFTDDLEAGNFIYYQEDGCLERTWSKNR